MTAEIKAMLWTMAGIAFFAVLLLGVAYSPTAFAGFILFLVTALAIASIVFAVIHEPKGK